MKGWSVRKCTGYGCVPFTQFFSQQLMCLGYNVASTYGLIGLLVLRGDYSLRELFKHITLLSSCSYEAKSNQSWTTTAAVSWVTAEVEPRIASNEGFAPTHDQEANVKLKGFDVRWENATYCHRNEEISYTKSDRYGTIRSIQAFESNVGASKWMDWQGQLSHLSCAKVWTILWLKHL